ncbi:hypothetical protein KKC91_09520 [bacterium]|nr:hypothetical protein [bacterium]
MEDLMACGWILSRVFLFLVAGFVVFRLIKRFGKSFLKFTMWMTSILLLCFGILYLYIFVTLGVTKPTLSNVAAAYYNKITPIELAGKERESQ